MEDGPEYESYDLEIALKLVENPAISGARWERELFYKIREELGPEDWQNLPALIREYRVEAHRQKERAEEERREAARRREEKRKQEQQRAAEERLEKKRQLERELQEKERHKEEKQTLLETLRECFERDFLTADNFYQTQCATHISSEEYETEKINYVQSWAKAKDYIAPKPDDEQAAAIGAVAGNVQVVARAGSGKTATLVNRALFLQQHCRVDADELLLLAFNKEAAKEMKERIGTVPHVMTFHALAYALVKPDKMLFDEPEGEQSQSQVLQSVVNQYLCDSNYADQIRDLMMEHFRDDWERHEDWQRIVSEGYGPNAAEILRYRRSLTRETLDGTYVKSFPEKVIANFLFEHNIEYKYERNFWWNGINYRPDFTIGDRSGVIIEYFGLKGDPKYDAMSEDKRNYWRDRPGWELIEFFPHDLKSNGVEGFYALLKQQLEDCEIPCNRLSEEEIWHRIKDRAIYRFTTVIRGFIQRCRKLSLTPEQLSEKVNNHDCSSDVEQDFLNLAQVFYASYLERLQATGEDDFDGLMQKAAALVAAGETEFRYKSGTGDRERVHIGNLTRIRYVLIDEYQDFSELFHRLMQAVRAQNPHAHFFCVGDDWQAINGFAGSDLRFFQNFEQFFEDSHELPVATNYRSARTIVNVGNALMRGQGIPARAHKTMTGKVAIADLGTFEPTPQEERENLGDNSTLAVLRLVNKAINDDKRVVLLSRTNNSPPWYVNYRDQRNPSIESGLDRFLGLLRARLPDELSEKVTISTAHGYKGLQQDVVIVLDAVPRCYPLIHPDLIFTRVFGDTIERVVAEERRLFYVALTRAVENLFILTETDNLSPFLEDLERNIEISRLEWLDYPPLVGTTQYITIRVGNQEGGLGNGTYAIRDLLGAEGYRWSTRWRVWYSTEPAEGFSVRQFANQATWSDLADGIEVGFYDHLDNMVELYHVDGGQWRRVSDTGRESDD